MLLVCKKEHAVRALPATLKNSTHIDSRVQTYGYVPKYKDMFQNNNKYIHVITEIQDLHEPNFRGTKQTAGGRFHFGHLVNRAESVRVDGWCSQVGSLVGVHIRF